jgi:hypothetical protein
VLTFMIWKFKFAHALKALKCREYHKINFGLFIAVFNIESLKKM